MADIKEQIKVDREQIDDRKARLMGALAGLASQSGGNVAALLRIPASIRSEIEKPYTPGALLAEEDPKMYRKATAMEKHFNLPRKLTYKTTADLSPYYDPIEHTVYLRSRSVPFLAHEIGHATPSKVIKPLSHLSNKLFFAKPLGASAALTMALSGDEVAQKYAPLVGVAPYLPTLADEARASAQGMRAIKATEGMKEAIKSIGTLGPAFLTYIASTLGPAVLAPWLAKAVSQHYRSKDEKKHHEKTSQLKGGTGKLQLGSQMAWASPSPKPHTTKPKQMPMGSSVKPHIGKKLSLPSKGKFYRDMLKSMDSKRGFRYV